MRLVVGRSVAFRLASCIGLAAILVSGSSLAQSLNLRARKDAISPTRADRPDFGTSSESILLMGADSFQLVDGTEGTIDDVTTSRICAAGGCIFIATPSLPSGALLTSLDLEACDGDAVGQFAFALFQFSQPAQMGTIVSTPVQSGATPGCVLMSAPVSRTVDNAAEKLIVDVNLDPGTNLKFSSARLHYMLQVSPAPGAATFGDVPTDHPFFQFVEALAASGITAGCGSGNYCPDQPLTRGQMAVFLSKALGLHFPN